jgi:hypothetical protein
VSVPCGSWQKALIIVLYSDSTKLYDVVSSSPQNPFFLEICIYPFLWGINSPNMKTKERDRETERQKMQNPLLSERNQ